MSTYSIYALPVYPKMAGKLRQFMYKVECDLYFYILYFIFLYLLYILYFYIYYIFYKRAARYFIPVFTLGSL
jgi:hypothetical protein